MLLVMVIAVDHADQVDPRENGVEKPPGIVVLYGNTGSLLEHQSGHVEV